MTDNQIDQLMQRAEVKTLGDYIARYEDNLAPSGAGFGIGDLHSLERGSGARFNAGKACYELILLHVLADSLPNTPSVHALRLLGRFQTTGDSAFLHELLGALGVDDGWAECAAVLDYGRRKYAAWNWIKGMPWSVVVASCARHLIAMQTEVVDDESGLPHRGHVFCNVMFLLTYASVYPEGNDLPPPGLFKRAGEAK